MTFRLEVSNLNDILHAHIHCGEAGVNGPVAVFLFGAGMTPGSELPSPAPSGPLAAPGVDVNGLLSRGTLTEANLIRSAQPCGASFSALVEALLAGRAYVNVHTVANPGGEIRGQVGVAVTPAPTPAAAPRTGIGADDDSHGWLTALLLASAGALLLIGGSYVLRRRSA